MLETEEHFGKPGTSKRSYDRCARLYSENKGKYIKCLL